MRKPRHHRDQLAAAGMISASQDLLIDEHDCTDGRHKDREQVQPAQDCCDETRQSDCGTEDAKITAT